MTTWAQHPQGPCSPTQRRNVLRRWGRWAAPLGLHLALLSACTGSLLPPPAAVPARFTLSSGPRSAIAARPPLHAPVITVELPRAAPGHDSRRMLYQRHAQQLQAFAFHEWVEPPPTMLTPLFVRALQDSARFQAVVSASSALSSFRGNGGWRLETDAVQLLQDFTVQPSQVRLSLRAVLLDSRTTTVIASQTFDVSVAALRDDPVSGAASAQVAAQQVAAALAAFCAAHTGADAPLAR
jgi:cholesterol transport system auxiliary component